MNPRAVTDALVGLALGRQLQGREAEADQCLREAGEFARWTGAPAYLDVVDSGRARIDLLRGDQDAAARWLAAFHGEPDVPLKIFFLEYPEITACRVLVAKGPLECLGQAATRLESLEAESRRFHHDCQLVLLLVMKSLLCERLYDKEIADRLSISPATVKTHLNRIYGKLGVSSRWEAARDAKRLGLV